ncbi:MAG TPA: glycoside hydrolase family 13 protein [Marmoricola sp.]|jgi:alpha-glucosidase
MNDVRSGVPWWRDAVCYEVYIRSFADSGDDGYGDIAGIGSRLDYLAELGVDALWITPFYPSPQNDHGYDVADYRDVDPTYGDLAGFDAMLTRAHELGLKVIVDLVPNHTSWDHPWFKAALDAGPGSPERARYVFRDGKGPDGSEPPNNWLSVFGGGAWERVPDGQWYLHLFDRSQPDLDWTNPEVAADFDRTLRFWLDRGVDGFRVDVAHGLRKAEGLPDVDDPRKFLHGTHPSAPMWDQPEVHEIYRHWNHILSEYDGDRMMVAEAWASTPARTMAYARPDEMSQAFNFHWLEAPWSASAFRDVVTLTLTEAASVDASATWVLSNHDVVRPPTRYGGGKVGLARAKAATLAMLALPGSAYLYQGEELGLEQVDVPEAQRQDPEFLNGRGEGRDGCRVPIPWAGTAAPYGNGSGKPWLPQPDDWAPLTVEAQSEDPESTLAFYRLALAERRGLRGDDVELVDLGEDVLAFRRDGVLVALNAGSEHVTLPEGEVVVASAPVDGTLPPDCAVWLRA